MRMIRKLWEKSKQVVAAVALTIVTAVGLGGVEVAHATVPAGVETLFTATATDFATVLGYGYTLFLAVIGGLIIIKLVKKVFFKAT